MTVKVQLLRSTTASKRPTASALLAGEVALNTNNGTPGAYFEDSGGNIIKLGPAEVGGTAPNASPAAGGSSGNSLGEFWFDTSNSGGNGQDLLKVYDGSSFSSVGSVTLGSTNVEVGASATTSIAGLTSVGSASFSASTGFAASNQGYIQLDEQTGNGSNYIRLTAPDAVTTNTTFKLPDGDGTSGQVLTTNGSGDLTWNDAAGSTVETQAISTDATFFPTFVADNNPNGSPAAELVYTDAGIAYNPSTNILTVGELSATTLDIGGTNITATAAEINTLDGITATTAELNILDGVTADATEINVLDGLTATTAELNTLDGITATTAELNFTDGVTSNIQTQLNNKLGSLADDTTPQLGGNLDLNSSDITGTGNIDITGTIDGTTLAINGSNITATAAELNTLDGITATTTELNYTDGVTSNIQTQLNAKQDIVTGGDGIDKTGNTLSVDLASQVVANETLVLSGMSDSTHNDTYYMVYRSGTRLKAVAEQSGANIEIDIEREAPYSITVTSSVSAINGNTLVVQKHTGYITRSGTTYTWNTGSTGGNYNWYYWDTANETFVCYNATDVEWTAFDLGAGTGNVASFIADLNSTGSQAGYISSGENFTLASGNFSTLSNSSTNYPAEIVYVPSDGGNVAYGSATDHPYYVYQNANANKWILFPRTSSFYWTAWYRTSAFDLQTETLNDDQTAFVLDNTSDFEYITVDSDSYLGASIPASSASEVSYTAASTGSYLEFDSGKLLVKVKDEDDMSSDSADHVPTQQSVKAYVDTEAAAVEAAALLRDGTQAATADLPMGSNKITGLAEPTTTSDAATKNYVDEATSGVGAFWTAADLVATSNLTLSGEQTIDGVLTSSSRVLVAGQTTQTENGIYTTGSGSWTRTSDADQSAEWLKNKTIAITSGNNGSGRVYAYTGDSNPTLGSDNLVFTLKQEASQIADGSITTAKLAPDAVTNAKLADDAVDTENIADDAITAALIDDGAVGTAAIDALAVTDAKINDVATTKLTGNMPDGRIVASNITQHEGSLNLANFGTRSIDNLSDVDISTVAPTDGQVLIWDNVNSIFEPGDQPSQASLGVDDLITLTGVAEGSTDLGTFTGTVIADNETIKGALQDLETYAEAVRPVVIEAYNSTGADLEKGKPVYISGTHSSGKPLVAYADADGSGTYPAIGLVESTETTNNDVNVVISGIIDGLNTSTFSVGDAVYLSTTAGVLTKTRPSGSTEQVQKVGVVTKSDSSTGSILVIGAGRTNDVPNEITALTGVALDATDLGTFTGSTIADNETIKGALQDLEDGIEGISVNSISQGDSSVTVTDTGSDGNIAFATDGSTRWNINLSGHLVPNADSTYNIGASGTEVLNVYADNLYGTLQTASQTNITGVGTLTAGTWNATTIGNAYGGTGLDTSSAANGALLIGNGSGLTAATLTEGQSVTITNGSGSITIAADVAQAAATSAATNAGVASFHSTYFSVDGDGFVEPVSTYGINSITSDSGSATPSSHGISISGGTGIASSATGSDITLNLTATGVTGATYGSATQVGTFTVDAQGRLTAASNIAISITSSAVTDFDTQVQTSRLDEMAAPTADVDLNSQKITGLADPTADSDAANKGYVDSVAQGLDVKASVVVASTGNLTLSGTQTVDGVALSVGDRILVKDQSSLPDNGIYVVASGSWSRSADASTWDSLVSAFVFVEEGTDNADNGYVCTINSGGTIGVNDIEFEQFSGAGQITAGAGLTKTGNTINAVGTANRITVNADDIDIASTYVGQTSITTLGTITSGTWNGDVIGLSYGGTGQANTNITANYVFAAPDGSAGNASFRALVADDISTGSFDAGTY